MILVRRGPKGGSQVPGFNPDVSLGLAEDKLLTPSR